MKRCGVCGEEKPIDQFFFKNTAKGKRHSRCKFCQQAYWREYYHSNPKLARWQVQRNDRYRKRSRAYIDEYLRSHPCVDCGISDPLVLEFDHVKGAKRAAISKLIHQALPISTLDKEIAKCEVRCANCHRRRTALSWPKRTRTRHSEGFSALRSS